MLPAPHVVAAFGGGGVPSPMAGGTGSTWRCGDVVLKPTASTEDELAWQATRLPDVAPLRLARPVSSASGRYVVDGWMATRFLAGGHRPGRWIDVIAVGDSLHAAIAGAARPAVLDVRSDPWAIADRLAWGEPVADPAPGGPLTARLHDMARPVPAPSQVVHGDLTGNILFAEGLPPAVLDLSLYWRPRDYATAIVVVDALAWEGATAEDLAPALDRAWIGQLLVRALLFRLYAAVLLDGPSARDQEPAYDAALELATAIVD